MADPTPTVPDDEDGHVAEPGAPSQPRPPYEGHPNYSNGMADNVTPSQPVLDADDYTTQYDEDGSGTEESSGAAMAGTAEVSSQEPGDDDNDV